MKKSFLGLVVCLTFLLLTGCVTKRQYVTLEADLNQKLQMVREKLRHAESRLETAEQKRDQYLEELKALQSQAHDLQADAEKQQSLLARQRTTEQELKDQVVALEADLNQQLRLAHETLFRATAVVRFLQDQGEIAPPQLSASGFSFYRPVASNDTEAGRRQNRRIEILLIPTRLRS